MALKNQLRLFTILPWILIVNKSQCSSESTKKSSLAGSQPYITALNRKKKKLSGYVDSRAEGKTSIFIL